MSPVTLYTAKGLLEKHIIYFTPLYPSNSKRRYFILHQPIVVLLSSNKIITIPAGFRTDLSSVPRWLWSFASPYGDFLLASVIHDYLYINNIGSRQEADWEMLIWSNMINDNKTDNFLRYKAVRWFGSGWWKKASKRIAEESAAVLESV